MKTFLFSFVLSLAVLFAGCRAPIVEDDDPFAFAPPGAIPSGPSAKDESFSLPRPEQVHAVAFFGDNVESEELPLEFVERDPARIAELLDAASVSHTIYEDEITGAGPLGFQVFLDGEGRPLAIAMPWLDSHGSVVFCPTNGWSLDGTALHLEERFGTDLRERFHHYWNRSRMYTGLVYDAMRRNDSASLRQMDADFEFMDGVESVLGMGKEIRERDREEAEAMHRLANIVIPSIAVTNMPLPEVFTVLEKAAAEAQDGQPPIRFVYQSRRKEGTAAEDEGPWLKITFSATEEPLKDIADIIGMLGLVEIDPRKDGTVMWRERFMGCSYPISGAEMVRGPYRSLPKKAEWRRRMETIRVDALSLRDEPIDKALAALASALGTNAPPMVAYISLTDPTWQTVTFHVPERADCPMQLPRVTLDVHDLTLHQVLDDIAGQANMVSLVSSEGIELVRTLPEDAEPFPTSASERWMYKAKVKLAAVLLASNDYRNTPISEILDGVRDALATNAATSLLQIRVGETVWRKSKKEGFTFHCSKVAVTDMLDILAGCQGGRFSAVGDIVWLGDRRDLYECIEVAVGDSPTDAACRAAIDSARLPGFSTHWTSLEDALRDIERSVAEAGEMPEELRGMRFVLNGDLTEASAAVPEETPPEDVVALRDGRLWLHLDRVSLHDLLDLVGNVARLRFTVGHDKQNPVIAVEPWLK